MPWLKLKPVTSTLTTNRPKNFLLNNGAANKLNLSTDKTKYYKLNQNLVKKISYN